MEGRRWENLDSNCLVKVFSKLGLHDLTLGIPFVCTSWHSGSLDPHCWAVLNFQDLDFTPTSKFVARFRKEYRIKNFSFSSFLKLCLGRSEGTAVKLGIPFLYNTLMQQDLMSASTACPRLKEVSLPTLMWPDDNCLPELVSRWKELEKLEMGWKPMSFPEMLEQIKFNCPNFVGLRFYGIVNASDALAVARCLPNLKSLMMTASYLRREELLVVIDGCKRLEELEIPECRGLHVDEEILNRASGIKKFDYRGCKPDENNEYYRYLQQLYLDMV